jgi:hypothetical protein
MLINNIILNNLNYFFFFLILMKLIFILNLIKADVYSFGLCLLYMASYIKFSG